MLNIIKEIISRYLDKNKEKVEYKEITEYYLLPETVDNLYELSKVKSSIPGAPGKSISIFDVVREISPDDFEVGNFYFPFIAVKLKYELFNKVEDKIMGSKDDDMKFFKKIYQAFKIVDKRKDLNKFKKHEYRIFSDAIKLAFKHEDLERFIENP